jgi:hypothetical protein
VILRPRRAYLVALVGATILPWSLWLMAYPGFHRRAGDVVWWSMMTLMVIASVAAAVSLRWYYVFLEGDAVGAVFGPWKRSVPRAQLTGLRKRVQMISGRPWFELYSTDGLPSLEISALAFTEDQMKDLAARLGVPFEGLVIRT